MIYTLHQRKGTRERDDRGGFGGQGVKGWGFRTLDVRVERDGPVGLASTSVI